MAYLGSSSGAVTRFPGAREGESLGDARFNIGAGEMKMG